MIQVLLAFLPFIRDVVFGHKKDKEPKSKLGKVGRFLIYGIFVASLSANYYLFKRSYVVSLQVVRLKEQVIKYQELKEHNTALQATVDALVAIIHDKLHDVNRKEKKQ